MKFAFQTASIMTIASLLSAISARHSSSTSTSTSTSSSSSSSDDSSSSTSHSKSKYATEAKEVSGNVARTLMTKAKVTKNDIKLPLSLSSSDLKALGVEGIKSRISELKTVKKAGSKLRKTARKFITKTPAEIAKLTTKVTDLEDKVDNYKAVPVHPMIGNAALLRDANTAAATVTTVPVSYNAISTRLISTLTKGRVAPDALTLANSLVKAALSELDASHMSQITDDLFNASTVAVSNVDINRAVGSTECNNAVNELRNVLRTAFTGYEPLLDRNVAVLKAAFTLMSQISKNDSKTKSKIHAAEKKISDIKIVMCSRTSKSVIAGGIVVKIDSKLNKVSEYMAKAKKVLKKAKKAERKAEKKGEKKPVKAEEKKEEKVEKVEAAKPASNLITYVIIGISLLVILGVIYFFVTKSN